MVCTRLFARRYIQARANRCTRASTCGAERTIGEPLGKRLGQPVFVENKPGASGNLGSDLVAKAPPDGYTLMVTANTFTMTPALYKALPYDPVNDFAPVARLAIGKIGRASCRERV